MKILTPQELADVMQAAAGDGFISARCTEWAEGIKGLTSKQVWVNLSRESLRPAIERLIELHFPHVAVIAFADTGGQVDLIYHLYVYYGIPHEEVLVTLTVSLDKTDLKIPTITDLIPGALTSEREKQEMLGIDVVGIPDDRRLFLPEDFPAGVYPWRKDESGIPADMIKDLWATGREGLPTCAACEAPPPAPAAQGEEA